MADLTLYGESTWLSPWVFHALVALEEKELAYELDPVPMPMLDGQRAVFREHAIVGKVPILAHGDLWISESLAISEYLAETFPTPGHPRLFPANLGERARSRQVMSLLRTSLGALREERPTSFVFGRAKPEALSANAQHDANELVRIAGRLLRPGRTSMFDAWCIADADLALALMRLVSSDDPVPSHLADYAHAAWERKSVRRYLSHVPTQSATG